MGKQNLRRCRMKRWDKNFGNTLINYELFLSNILEYLLINRTYFIFILIKSFFIGHQLLFAEIHLPDSHLLARNMLLHLFALLFQEFGNQSFHLSVHLNLMEKLLQEEQSFMLSLLLQIIPHFTASYWADYQCLHPLQSNDYSKAILKHQERIRALRLKVLIILVLKLRELEIHIFSSFSFYQLFFIDRLMKNAKNGKNELILYNILSLKFLPVQQFSLTSIQA